MQQKKLTHGYQNPHSKVHMAKYDPENAQAWAVIMKKVREEYASGSTQLAIAKKLGVSKVAVSRWLSEDRGGERTTFGDMLRYARTLGISINELVGVQQPPLKVTSFDKALAKILKQGAEDAELTITDIAASTHLSTAQLNTIFSGKVPITAELLNKIAKAVEVGPSVLLKRTERLLEE